MRILADTSVWVDHLRSGNAALEAALENGDVITHPFVIGELACGNLRDRRVLLGLLDALPSAPVATSAEALGFIEHRLMGRGIGYVDVHLLASALLAGDARLWTLDRRLAAIASALKLAARI
ncbi:MAG TPA: PIN domain-containing protein [Gemmatimonadaceae bacterium]|nr:PIN domain-containing protein [Gemmatimonadaceae bacterium]